MFGQLMKLFTLVVASKMGQYITIVNIVKEKIVFKLQLIIVLYGQYIIQFIIKEIVRIKVALTCCMNTQLAQNQLLKARHVKTQLLETQFGKRDCPCIITVLSFTCYPSSPWNLELDPEALGLVTLCWHTFDFFWSAMKGLRLNL